MNDEVHNLSDDERKFLEDMFKFGRSVERTRKKLDEVNRQWSETMNTLKDAVVKHSTPEAIEAAKLQRRKRAQEHVDAIVAYRKELEARWDAMTPYERESYLKDYR